MPSVDPIVVIGAGHCGGRAAEWLRRLGYDGALTLIGAEVDAPYERPPLSKDLITGDKSFPDCRLHPDRFYAEQRIELVTGQAVVTIDPAATRVALASGDKVKYSKLLIASGAAPRRLPLTGHNLTGVHTLRDRVDSEAIRAKLGPGARLAVVGGGFIGLEVAAAARRLGAEVVVLEGADRLLGRSLPREAAAAIANLHRNQGVEIRLSAVITGLAGETEVRAVELADGSRIETSVVVIGVGIRPRTELAEAAGIPCDDGILAAADCRTEEPNIFVAGDAARAFNTRYDRRLRLESWQNAEQQAEVAARAMLGLEAKWNSVPWVWSDFYDWNLQVAGFPTEAETIVRRGDPADGAALYLALSGETLVGAVALGKGLRAAKDLRLAQLLIERGARPRVEALADPATSLKALLKAA